MIAWVACAVLATDWLEVGTGVPFEDDITVVRMLDGPNDLWIGTRLGYVYRSGDGGETLQRVFEPMAGDPWVVPQLEVERAPSVGDLARGLGRDVPVRDVEAHATQQADIAGNVRERPRDRGTKVLSSLTRAQRRNPGTVNVVARCHEWIFVATASGLWRSRRDVLHFTRSHIVPGGQDAQWVTCDWSRPGRLAVMTQDGVLESVDGGETFFPYANALPLGGVPAAASFDGGVLTALLGRAVLRENPDGRGYRTVCYITSDSVESQAPEWTWETDNGEIFAVTRDGVLVCKDDVTVRLADDTLARKPIRAIYIAGERNEYIAVATADDVFESRDGGKTFHNVYARRTARSIGGIGLHESAPEALVVATGSQIFRRAEQPRWATETPALVERLLAGAPLWEVVHAALERLELDPGRIAGRRHDSALASAMPFLSFSVTHEEARSGISLFEQPGTRQIGGRERDDLTVWRGLIVLDLADLVSSPSQTDRAWVDIERLRREVTYRVEDAYTVWARAVLALARGSLDARQRAYHELTRREMAAYLNHMTGAAFAAFDPQGAPP